MWTDMWQFYCIRYITCLKIVWDVFKIKFQITVVLVSVLVDTDTPLTIALKSCLEKLEINIKV